MPPRKVRVKVPLHITGFWAPVYKRNPVETGSIGAGLNIQAYFDAVVEPGDCSLVLNQRRVNVPVLDHVCRLLGEKVKVYASTPLPLGAGYGLSAAIALTAAVGIAFIRGTSSIEEAIWAAHKAEVLELTGLGDVIAMYYGGFEARVEPGPPGIGFLVKLPYDPGLKIVTAALGTMDTRVMLKTYPYSLYQRAREYLKLLIENPSLELFLDLAGRFTRRFFDYGRVDEILRGIGEGVVGYYVKKKALVVVVESDRVGDVMDKLMGRGLSPIETSISFNGLYVAT